MIYTLTLNPAIDYYMHFDNIKIGEVCRANSESILIGGKGINVSLVLSELEVASVATGFLSGFTGDYIENQLKNNGINSEFIRLNDGITRINVKIKSDKETDLNAMGPDISKNDINKLKKYLSKLKERDILIISGSVPKNLPPDIYSQILEEVDKNVLLVFDISGKQIFEVLKFKPFLIKPNNFELGEIFGVNLSTADEAEEYARKLQEMGAKNVLVSLGENGAMLIDEYGNRHNAFAIEGEAVNTVGAGDSMVAGFLAGYFQKNDYSYALKLGNAAGSATAFSEGLATKNEILNCLEKVK